MIRTPQVNLEAFARELGALADYEFLEPDEPDAIPDASEEPALPLDRDFPSMVEACARLEARQIPFRKCTESHLKIGPLNYYPRRGITCLDGAPNSYPTKGFANLLQIVRDVAGRTAYGPDRVNSYQDPARNIMLSLTRVADRSDSYAHCIGHKENEIFEGPWRQLLGRVGSKRMWDCNTSAPTCQPTSLEDYDPRSYPS